MNGEHLSGEKIKGYAKRTLSRSELLAVDDHCLTCRECRQKLADSAGISAAYAGLVRKFQDGEEIDHLTYEQLQSYVDDSAGAIDREIFESHLEACPQCDEEAKDLFAFKAGMGRDKAAATKVSSFPIPRTPVKPPLLLAAVRLAGIAAALVVCVWIAVVPFRKRISELESQLLQSQSENEKLHQQSASTEEKARALQQQLEVVQQGKAGLRDGGTVFAFDADQNLKGADSMPAEYQRMIRQALLTQKLETPPLLGKIIGQAGTLMGSSGTGVPFALLQPVGTAVLSDKPVFDWNALAGAESYRVGISDTEFNEVESSPALKDTTWKPGKPLKRGAIYIWQVTAVRRGAEVKSPAPPAPDARFSVLDSESVSQLAAARQKYGDSHLLMGVLCARYGLLDDAESEFQELLKANPTSREAEELLQNVRNLRRTSQTPAPK